MEEAREGIAVAGGHGAGLGLFTAVVSTMAARDYRPSLSSPSTPPPPAAAGHGGDAAATAPLPPWSLGGEKPGEAAADSGMQAPGFAELAGSSSGRRRGRPRGSGRRQILATLGEWYALSAGGSFTPHVLIVAAGEDVAARIMSFSRKGPRSVCILSANGTISSVALNQPGSSGSTFTTYEGLFEILQLTGSFTMAEEGRRRTGGLSVSLAGPDGRVVGGVVAGMLCAASPIQVVVGSFLPNSLKQHQRRMGQQQQSSPPPPPVLTAAMPLSQAAPGNGCHVPPPASTTLLQAHAIAEPGAGTAMSLNLSSSSTGFTMARRPSPDINICLTPRE